MGSPLVLLLPCRCRNPGGVAAEFPQRALGAGKTRLAQVRPVSLQGLPDREVPEHYIIQGLDFPPFPLHKSCSPSEGHVSPHFWWWLAPLGTDQGHFQHAVPVVPPSLTALLFLQGGFDGAGCGGEGCRGLQVGWRRGTEGPTPCCTRAVPCSWLPSRHRSPLAAALQIPFPMMLLVFGSSCISMAR